MYLFLQCECPIWNQSKRTLHSKMYLFLRIFKWNHFSGLPPLHSKMYLFLRHGGRAAAGWYGFTFQNVSISTFRPSACRNFRNYFTFQNVSISTMNLKEGYVIAHDFTFQNVSISTQRTGKQQISIMLYIPKCIYFYLVGSLLYLLSLCLYIPKCIYFYNDIPAEKYTPAVFTFQNVSISTHPFALVR